MFVHPSVVHPAGTAGRTHARDRKAILPRAHVDAPDRARDPRTPATIRTNSPSARWVTPRWRTLSPAVCALVTLLVALAGWTQAARADERIEAYHSEIVVQADGELVVSETITVRAEQQEIRRGIYRDFPLTFSDADGQTRRVTFKLLEAQRDGVPEPHFERGNAAGVRIYIGDEDVLLSPGVYRYRLRYRTGRQLRWFPDHVELNWNVTGNDWQFPIGVTTARVHLPDNAAPVRWTAWTGRYGEQGTDWRAGPGDDGSLEFTTTRRLARGEGFTIAVQLPDGIVAAPTRTQELRWAMLDHGRSLLGFAGLLAVLVFYLTAWNAVGRDPPKGTIFPRFHPPEGISPALAAYVRQWGWGHEWREWTATAVSLATKGLITFDDSSGLRFDRTEHGKTAGATPALDISERSLLGWIDGEGGSVRIDRNSGERLVTAEAALRDGIERDNRGRFFRRNRRWFWFGLLLTAGCIALVLRYGRLTDGEIGVLIFTGFFGFFFGTVMAQSLRTAFRTRATKAKVEAILRLSVFLVILLIGAGRFLPSMLLEAELRSAWLHSFMANMFPIVLIGSFGLLNAVFWYLLRAPTVAGRKLMDEIEGLELYLRTAESARMNLPGAPEITTAHFERLLPYAIALGVEKPWSQAFEAAFTRAHPGESLQAGYQPTWHAGRGWSGSGGFGSSLAAAMGAAQGAFASSVPAPSAGDSGFSGGGGGGGGSGGGGGGGGGGGW